MNYKPSPTDRFKKAYKKKIPAHQELVDKTLKILLVDPRYPSLKTHRVQGTAKVWECYMNDALRITFEYSEDRSERKIVLRNNCTHDKVLRKP